jgi:hypothetical protein
MSSRGLPLLAGKYCKDVFLLIFVKGLELDFSDGGSGSDEEVDADKSYTDFYRDSPHKHTFKEFTKICSLCLSFVCNEPAEKVPFISRGSSKNNWCTEPLIFHKALLAQKNRARSRLESLEFLHKLIIEKKSSPTVSNIIHPQLLSGYFGFCNFKSEDISAHLRHYLENVQGAPVKLQQEIRINMHKIVEFLIKSLHQQISAGFENKQLLLTTLFTLTTKYEPVDLNFAIRKTLLSSLITVTNDDTNKTDILNVSAIRLIRILAMCACVHSKRIELTTLQNIVDRLHEQFMLAIESHDDMTEASLFSLCDKSFGDLLLFLRIISSSRLIKVLLASKKWLYALLSVLDTSDLFLTYTIQLKLLRPKMLVLQILQNIKVVVRSFVGFRHF